MTSLAAIELPPVVLLVDDETEFREEFALLLSRRGCEVSTATNGMSALQKIAADTRIEVLVTDLRMPGMDGLELVEKARCCRTGSDCMGFIVVTGNGDFLSVSSEIQGADIALLQKPVTIPAFLDRLASILAHVRRERAAAG